MNPRLQALAAAQGRWSATANALKARYDSARQRVFVCTIVGAASAALASQLQDTARAVCAGLGTLALAYASFLTARRLGEERALAWVRARGASEALKREAYLYCSRATPYDADATRDGALAGNIAQIETGVDDLVGQLVEGPPGHTPQEELAPDAYVEQRVRQQAEDYYAPRAEDARRSAARFRDVEFVLAFVTMILTAVLASVPKTLVEKVPFDLLVLVSVLTTVSGTIVAHVESSRFDFLVISYRVTARRLRELLLSVPSPVQVPSTAWSAFVAQCESVLAEQNGSWSAKFGKPQPPVTAAAGAAPADAVAADGAAASADAQPPVDMPRTGPMLDVQVAATQSAGR